MGSNQQKFYDILINYTNETKSKVKIITYEGQEITSYTEDIVVDYSKALALLPPFNKTLVIENIEKIQEVMDKIKKVGKLEYWNHDHLPEIGDYLKILNDYTATKIFDMIKEGGYTCEESLIEKYQKLTDF